MPSTMLDGVTTKTQFNPVAKAIGTSVTQVDMKPIIKNGVPCMSSSQLVIVFKGKYKKSRVNEKIRELFGKEADTKFVLATDTQNRVSEYALPQVEANMLVGKWDSTHLRTLAEFFVNGSAKPAKTGNPYLDTLIAMQLQSDETRAELQAHTNQLISLGSEVAQTSERMSVLEKRVEDAVCHPQADTVPANMLSVGDMYHQLRKYGLSRETVLAVAKSNDVAYTHYTVIRNGRPCEVEHYDKGVMDGLLVELITNAVHRKDTKFTHDHPTVHNFKMVPQSPF